MNDLHKLFEDASVPRDPWSLDRQALVVEGHKRVARRRWIISIACAATVAVIAGVAATLPEGSNTQPAVDQSTAGSGDYVEKRIPVAEVERRCTIAMNTLLGLDSSTRWVAGNRGGRAVSAKESGERIENREGMDVVVAQPGDKMPGRADTCTIPQESMLDDLENPGPAQVPPADDEAGIADWCSRTSGFDIRGWKVLAAVAYGGDVDSVAMSDNGYAVTCSLSPAGGVLELHHRRYHDDEGAALLPRGDTGVGDPKRYEALFPGCYGSGEQGAPCVARGVIPGLPDGYGIEVRFDDGTHVTTKTNRGGFAYTFRDNHSEFIEFFVTDSDGEVVWTNREPWSLASFTVPGD